MEEIKLTREAYERILDKAEKNGRLEEKIDTIRSILDKTCNNGGCSSLKGEKGWRVAHTWALGVIVLMLLAVLAQQLGNHFVNQAGFAGMHETNGAERLK
jgi:hypothetical protein